MTRPRMNRPVHRPSEAHVPAAAALIGGLAVLLAAGLHALGMLARADAALAAAMLGALGQPAATGFPKDLPEWAVWTGTAAVAFGLALAMLTIPGGWRRIIVWISTLTLTAAWAPVLALAAHTPRLSGAVAAVLWAGVCAWFYARSHPLPCDRPPPAAPRVPSI